MSNFLLNLARRGAGLPATTIQPPSSPFRPKIGRDADELTETHGSASYRLAEEPAAGSSASPSPLPTSSSEEHRELSFDAPAHPAPSVQRFFGTELNTPVQPAVRYPAAARTPLAATSMSQRRPIPDGREATAVQIEMPTRLNAAAPPFHPDREVSSEIESEQRWHSTAPAAREIRAVSEPVHHTSSVAPGPPAMVAEPDQRQTVTPVVSTDGRGVEARETREPALAVPTIHPLTESRTLLHFPKTISASLPAHPAQIPIHVRIGRVEVRATTAPTTKAERPSRPAPVGFDSYYRVRNYRS